MLEYEMISVVINEQKKTNKQHTQKKQQLGDQFMVGRQIKY